MTQLEKDALRDYIISYAIANSQGINDLPDATNLSGISSFPVIQEDAGNFVAKKAAISLLQPVLRSTAGYIQYQDLQTLEWVNIITAEELTSHLELSGYVNTTVDQIIDGIKTFNSSPIIPTPTTSSQASTKGYVDNNLSLKVDNTTKVIAGNGLIGGGSLSNNITLNVETANDGLLINPDNIQLQTVDNLNGTSPNKPLSSNQGKILNETKINLNGLNSDLSKLHFNPDTLSQLTSIGDVRYSPESKTLEVKVSDTVSIQLGQEMQTRIKNDAGVQINNG